MIIPFLILIPIIFVLILYRYKTEIYMFGIVVIPYLLYYVMMQKNESFVSLFAMEMNLISKYGPDLSFLKDLEFFLVIGVYMLIFIFSHLSQWSMAACYREVIAAMRFGDESELFGKEKDDSFKGSIGNIYQSFAG